jgi:2-keto-4-pentenoate hydratase/2-oxohepta-3-ene-1,7-dioic acid hydratase in catechol pathway
MRIIRFADQTGQTQWGIPVSSGMAELLAGPDIFELRRTGQETKVSQLLAPLEPRNIFCIGLNYRRHAKETNAEIPDQPVVFMKPTSALNHPNRPIRLPACCHHGPEVDYEGELAIVIGRRARNVSPAQALGHIFGYTAAIDVSARRWQKSAGGGQWIRGKGFDTFCPLGPMLVTADEIPDPQNLRLATTLNNQVMQNSNTSDMIFPVAELVSFLSMDTTLLPGTVILTGTPEGVGFVRQPPVFLKPGDELSVEIDGIGRLSCPVEAG